MSSPLDVRKGAKQRRARRHYKEVFPPSGNKSVALLDLCSSWISHYPPGYTAGRIAGAARCPLVVWPRCRVAGSCMSQTPGIALHSGHTVKAYYVPAITPGNARATWHAASLCSNTITYLLRPTSYSY